MEEYRKWKTEERKSENGGGEEGGRLGSRFKG